MLIGQYFVKPNCFFLMGFGCNDDILVCIHVGVYSC